MQSGKNRNHAKHPARDVDDRRAGAKRSVGEARHVSQAAHHLSDLVQGHPVLIGAREESFERAVNEARVFRRQ